jgi:hypothetical protein
MKMKFLTACIETLLLNLTTDSPVLALLVSGKFTVSDEKLQFQAVGTF